jgi:hypothetical protein
VCSEESIEIIESHLSECNVCKEYYSSLCEANEIIITLSNTDRELKKAASFQEVKKKLLRKQVFIIVIIFAFLSMIAFTVISGLKSSVNIIAYEDNISVSMTDDSLIGRLQGSQSNYFKVKTVEITAEEQINTYLFFYMSDTKWNKITTSSEVFSEYVLCPADKGSEQIDRVYYYSGDYTGIETRSKEELQEIIDNSVLLWSK